MSIETAVTEVKPKRGRPSLPPSAAAIKEKAKADAAKAKEKAKAEAAKEKAAKEKAAAAEKAKLKAEAIKNQKAEIATLQLGVKEAYDKLKAAEKVWNTAGKALDRARAQLQKLQGKPQA